MNGRKVIPVPDLRIGMTIVEPDGGRTYVKTVDACTQPRKLHVNSKDCYDYVGFVTVLS